MMSNRFRSMGCSVGVAILAVAGGFGGGVAGAEAGCADPLILDQMRRESVFAAPDGSLEGHVRLTDPEAVSVAGGVRHCRARWSAEASVPRLVPVLAYGYPFTLADARGAFDDATGMPADRFEQAADYLRERAASGKAASEVIRLSAPVVYRMSRQARPFLLDWRFESTDIAAEAGRHFADAVAAERERERAETLALARERGFDSIRAMQQAEAEARAAREQLQAVRNQRNEIAGRLDELERERDAVLESLDDVTARLARLRKSMRNQRSAAEDWKARIKRESFARKNDHLEFSDTRVFSGQSSFGLPEQAVVTEVINFSDQTYHSVVFHVVVWHDGLERFFEDRKMTLGFGKDGLSPGESQTLRLSLNGQPAIGLAFTGKEFRSEGERHAFLSVRALLDEHGQPMFRDAWRSPVSDAAAKEEQMRELATERDDLASRLEALKQRIADQQQKLKAAENAVERQADNLPPLPSEMAGDGA